MQTIPNLVLKALAPALASAFVLAACSGDKQQADDDRSME